jgi:hypothetical protein
MRLRSLKFHLTLKNTFEEKSTRLVKRSENAFKYQKDQNGHNVLLTKT